MTGTNRLQRFWYVVCVVAISAVASCSRPESVWIDTSSAQGTETGEVVFAGGYETAPQDGGRPVVLIASALDVPTEVFRQAFSGVNPSRMGPPTPGRARANKEVLMRALAGYGVTNERLDEVSNYYRYRPQSGELWNHTPATATAQIEQGKVVGLTITHPGSGYSTAPRVRIVGYEDITVRAEIGFSTQFSTNGRVTSLFVKR